MDLKKQNKTHYIFEKIECMLLFLGVSAGSQQTRPRDDDSQGDSAVLTPLDPFLLIGIYPGGKQNQLTNYSIDFFFQ